MVICEMLFQSFFFYKTGEVYEVFLMFSVVILIMCFIFNLKLKNRIPIHKDFLNKIEDKYFDNFSSFTEKNAQEAIDNQCKEKILYCSN